MDVLLVRSGRNSPMEQRRPPSPECGDSGRRSPDLPSARPDENGGEAMILRIWLALAMLALAVWLLWSAYHGDRLEDQEQKKLSDAERNPTRAPYPANELRIKGGRQ